MLLRSSSTPVLGSLLQSFSESPNNSNHHHQPHELHGGSTHKHTPNKLISCNSGGSQNFSKSLHQSPSVAEIKSSQNGIRRAHSEGNLQDKLANISYNVDEFTLSKKSARRTSFCTLEAIPSFTSQHLGSSYDESDFDEDEEIEKDNGDQEMGLDNSFNPLRAENLVFEQGRTNNVSDYGGLRFEGAQGKMYLASGLGVSGFNLVAGGSGSSGGGSYRPLGFDKDGGDSHDVGMEEHYKRMLEENPGNPLFLRNYAQFLYQKKGDLEGAEAYYSRAILADPEDGEVLSQYGQLLWELHRDKERAAMYLERAVRASSEDSHVHAAYASFLWDTEDDDEDEGAKIAADGHSRVVQPLLHHGFMASATA